MSSSTSRLARQPPGGPLLPSVRNVVTRRVGARIARSSSTERTRMTRRDEMARRAHSSSFARHPRTAPHLRSIEPEGEVRGPARGGVASSSLGSAVRVLGAAAIGGGVVMGEGPVVFVSYSREDAEWRRRFAEMLAPVVRRRGLEVWSDERNEIGYEWRPQLEQAIARSKAALLLVSPSFLASGFIMGEELPALIRQRVRLVPVLVRHCMWEQEPLLERRQWAHDPNRDGPVEQAASPEGAIVVIVIGTDTHKQTHALSAVDEGTGKIRGHRQIDADELGHLAAVKWARELDDERVWAIEDC